MSRRAIFYELTGLSFREYILFRYGINFSTIDLENIVYHSSDVVPEILKKIKPVARFKEYIRIGYYPFFLEGIEDYASRLANIVNVVLESDLPFIHGMKVSSIIKLKKLIFPLASMPPYTPNISELARQLDVTRDTLLKYLYYLDKARLISLLTANKFGINYMNKPEKIYLHNPNLFYAINPDQINAGSLRESFFFNQLKNSHQVIYTKEGDFIVDDKITFEIGGKNKQHKQIKNIHNAFTVKDDIEYASLNTIPLWLFGFLY